MNKDEFTSTDRAKLYVVRFSPGGERFVVIASNAQVAQSIGIGFAAIHGVRYNGIDSYPAQEEDIDHPDNVSSMVLDEEE